MPKTISIADFTLVNHAGDEGLIHVINAIVSAATRLSRDIRNAGLEDHILGAQGLDNVQGEAQQKLDLVADNAFVAAFQNCGVVCGIASEENDDFVAFTSQDAQNGKYIVLFDPLDGSSNIDVNVSIGTIFAVYRRISPTGTMAVLEDMLQPGTQQVAAGYVLYGSSTMLVYSTGNGVNGFTLDTELNKFFLSHPMMKMPEMGRYYAMNEGNINECEPALKDYIAYCQSHQNDFNSPYSGRYIGSLVADFHRNLIKGGIYIYPAVPAHPMGRLRLLYECNPLAFIAEQAGGLATTGRERILSIQPQQLHQRVPYFIGSKSMVQKAMSFLK